MSQNTPFIFGAGQGQPPPTPRAQQQHHHNTTPSLTQPQPLSASVQQAAFHQNTQLPTMDMSALAGISPEQLAAIGRLFQTGALTLPPQPQDISAQVPASIETATQALPTVSHVPHISNAASTPQEDVDMDKEEGELEEGEVGDTPKERDFLRPPPTGPRNRSISPRGLVPQPAKQSNRPPNPKLAVDNSKQMGPQHAGLTRSNGRIYEVSHASKEEAAKLFVLEMVKSGYTFDDLVKEMESPKPLIRLFKQLHLPMSPKGLSNKPLQQNGVTIAQPQPPSPDVKPAVNEENRKISVAKRPAPAKPLDRSEYLARLAAAKNKKADTAPAQEDSVKPAIKPVEEPVISSQPTKQAETSEGNGTKGLGKAVAVIKADKTELARRRLEALKAQQAAKQSDAGRPNGGVAMSSSVGKPIAPTTEVLSSPAQPSLGAGIADIPAKATQITSLQQQPTRPTLLPPAPPQAISPTPPTPSRSFSGLPGLFMLGTPTHVPSASTMEQPAAPSHQPNLLTVTHDVPQAQAQTNILPASSHTLVATPTASPAPLAVPRKRPVAADFDDFSAKPSFTKRPFGQSIGNSEDESLIIEVSDDEDDDVDMEIDDVAASSMVNPQTKSFRDVGPLRDFPPRMNVTTQIPGASTPGTPGGVTYEQRLKEIEDMKRKIAEAEKRKIANGKVVGAKANETGVVNGTSAVPTPVLKSSSVATPEGQQTPKTANVQLAFETSASSGPISAAPSTSITTHARSVSSNRAMSVATLARQQEKERLRQRLLELERDESREVTEAVVAAAGEPEPMHPSTPLTTSAAVSVPTAEQMLQEVEGQYASAEVANNSVSEEGELSDDSMSNIYDLPNAQDTRVVRSAPIVDDRKVGSQTTTTSAMSGPEPVLSQNRTATVNGSQSSDPVAHDVGIGGGSNAQVEIMTPAETQLPDSLPQDSEMAEVIQDNVALSESMDEDREEDDEDYSNVEDEDGENHDDLDQPLSSRQTDHVTAQHDMILRNGREDGEIDDIDSSSASSTNFEDHQLEPVEESATDAIQVGKAAAMAAISDVSATEAVIKSNVAEDDLAPELQPTSEQLSEPANQKLAKSRKSYTPYESGLKMFKAYRWHPSFVNEVQGGFKSMTYSHNIDPVKPLCPFESAGGKCNDKTCQNQHFRDMAQSDNDLLKDLGTTNLPTHTPEEKRKWNDGLGLVIRQLRTTTQGRDAHAIAAKISEFRRDFVGDPTKVLNLG